MANGFRVIFAETNLFTSNSILYSSIEEFLILNYRYCRGGAWEKLGSFCERILNKYVGAQLLRTNAAPSEDVINSPGAWIQITAVNPEIDVTKWGKSDILGPQHYWENSAPAAPKSTSLSLTSSLAVPTNPDPLIQSAPPPPLDATPPSNEQQTVATFYFIEPLLDPFPESLHKRATRLLEKLAPPIKAYYTSNETNLFTFTRPFKRAPARHTVDSSDPSKEIQELWTEKTLLVTREPFPCLSHRSLVVTCQSIEISPIQNAVIAVLAKNKQLRSLEDMYRLDAHNTVDSTMSNFPVPETPVSSSHASAFFTSGSVASASTTTSSSFMPVPVSATADGSSSGITPLRIAPRTAVSATTSLHRIPTLSLNANPGPSNPNTSANSNTNTNTNSNTHLRNPPKPHNGGPNHSAPRPAINPFTMALQGAVDAPVNGGVPMYRHAFLEPWYRETYPSDVAYVEMLEAGIEEQVWSVSFDSCFEYKGAWFKRFFGYRFRLFIGVWSCMPCLFLNQ
jgi:hypothetical protein